MLAALAALPLLTLVGPVFPSSAVASLPGPAELRQDEALEDEYDELRAAYKKAALHWRRDRRAAKRQGVEEKAPPHPIHEYYPRFEELAGRGSGQALQWTALSMEDLGLSDEEYVARKRAALAKLVEGFADQPYMERLLRAVRPDPLIPGEEMAGYLTVIYERNDDPELRAQAAYAVALQYESAGNEAGLEKAEEWYRRVIEDHYDDKLANRAKGRLAGLHIAVGRVAPDFEAEDVDGTPFKLSDYRGKIVVLDFWGFW